MFAQLLTWVLNLVLRLGNLWRRILRRRVDYVRLRLSGGIPEFADRPPRWQRMLLGARPPLSVAGLRRMFRRVAADPQVRGVLLEIDSVASGWATLQSIRAEIAELRAAGKRVVAYLITPDVSGAYIAAAADTLLIPPTAFWSVLGIRSEVQFLRDALARWGIEVEATAVSPYKSAPDT
jgi:protease IV